jgi:uncharacterized protein GlcG (DUF336 family)
VTRRYWPLILTLAGAWGASYLKNIADRAEAESIKQEVPVAVTVIDIHGNVVLTHRMTGAPAFSLELAERKDYVSATIRSRTRSSIRPGMTVASRERSLLLVQATERQLRHAHEVGVRAPGR